MRQSIPGMGDVEFRRLYVYCLIPDCDNIQKDRGVCRQHLEAVQKQVDNNEVTWKAYEEAGYSRPPGPIEELRDRRLHRGPVDECMTEECEHPAIARGLCSNCYQSSYRLIRQKKTTWEKLEEVGVAQKGTRVRRGVGESLVCKKIEATGGLLEETDRHLGRKPPVAPEQPEPAAPVEPLIASPGVVEDLNRLAEEQPQPASPLGQPPKEEAPSAEELSFVNAPKPESEALDLSWMTDSEPEVETVSLDEAFPGDTKWEHLSKDPNDDSESKEKTNEE